LFLFSVLEIHTKERLAIPLPVVVMWKKADGGKTTKNCGCVPMVVCSQAPALMAGCSRAMPERSLPGRKTSNRRAKGQFPVKSPSAALQQAQKLKDLPLF